MARNPRTLSVGIKELKDQASAILERVQRTRQPVTVTKNNRDVAHIVPIPLSSESISIRQRIADLGMLAVPARLTLKDLKLENVHLDSKIALKTILEDRDED